MDYLKALRPQQWVKNFFVFAALLFSQNVFNRPLLIETVLAFAFFCLASSGVYVLNDLMDVENDRRHPTKKNRPIAAGRISLRKAWALSFLLMAIALIGGYKVQPWFGLIVGVYLANNILYSFYLKNIVLIDVFMIALGFVLRVVGGAVAIQVAISSWLVICTILLSLFLAFSKRRHEIILLDQEAANHRAILKEYSPYFLDQMISVVTASTVVAYSLYTMSEEVRLKFGSNRLELTIPFVLYGIFRYLYLVHQKEEGGSPTKALLSDLPLLFDIALWALSVFIIIYFR